MPLKKYRLHGEMSVIDRAIDLAESGWFPDANAVEAALASHFDRHDVSKALASPAFRAILDRHCTAHFQTDMGEMVA